MLSLSGRVRSEYAFSDTRTAQLLQPDGTTQHAARKHAGVDQGYPRCPSDGNRLASGAADMNNRALQDAALVIVGILTLVVIFTTGG